MANPAPIFSSLAVDHTQGGSRGQGHFELQQPGQTSLLAHFSWSGKFREQSNKYSLIRAEISLYNAKDCGGSSPCCIHCQHAKEAGLPLHSYPKITPAPAY